MQFEFMDFLFHGQHFVLLIMISTGWKSYLTSASLFQFEKSSRISKEAEDQLKVIPKFCFPDCQDWKPSAQMPRSAFSLH